MSLFLLGMWNQFKGWIVGAGVLLLAIASVYGKGRSDGKEKAIEDDRKELQKDVQDKKELDEDIANDSDSELNKRLQRWVKD